MAHLQLGQLLARHGRCTEAARVLARCAQLSATGVRDRRAHQAARVSALLLLGNLHAEQGRGQRALAAYRRALELRPPRYPPQVNYAATYLNTLIGLKGKVCFEHRGNFQTVWCPH